MPTNSGLTEAQRHPHGLPLPSKLRHRYLIMRHGFSVPNHAKVICSSLEQGVQPDQGLTDFGRSQVRESVGTLASFLESTISTSKRAREAEDIVVVASPFTRAWQTAKIVCESIGNHPTLGDHLRTSEPMCAAELRERFFGQLDKKEDDKYQLVWEKDALNGDSQTAFEAESCLNVWLRIRELILRLEEQLRKPSTVLLVSHGDTLQITQTGFDSSKALCSHRKQVPLHQAEWRLLIPRTEAYPVMVSKL